MSDDKTRKGWLPFARPTFQVERSPWTRTLELFMSWRWNEHGRERFAYCRDLVIEEPAEDIFEKNPSMRFDGEAAQQLMDELWRCGLRPTEGTGSAGAMKAVQDHLHDMRQLVFGTTDGSLVEKIKS